MCYYNIFWQHLLWFTLHSSNQNDAVGGRLISICFSVIIHKLVSKFDCVFVPHFFLNFQVCSRSGDYGRKLGEMSACFAVLIFCSILWRPLSDFSTSMPMSRYIISTISPLFQIVDIKVVSSKFYNMPPIFNETCGLKVAPVCPFFFFVKLRDSV